VVNDDNIGPHSTYKIGRVTTFECNLDIAEIIAFESELPHDEADKIESYLAHKWGLADQLTTGHPYKDRVAIRSPRDLGVSTDLTGLVKGNSYYYRVKAENTEGTDWADSTTSFVSESRIDLSSGDITFYTDPPVAWTASDGSGGNGVLETLSWTDSQSNTVQHKVAKFSFSQINIGDGVRVSLIGSNPIHLDVENNATILAMLDASGSSDSNSSTLGGGFGGISVNHGSGPSHIIGANPYNSGGSRYKGGSLTGSGLVAGEAPGGGSYGGKGGRPELNGGTDSLVVVANPAALSNPALWLDAADSSTLFSEHTFYTSATTKWQDKSGNGKHATQASSSKPTYSISDSLLKNKSSVSSSSQNGSIGLDLPSISLQEIFVVAYYKDGSDNSFDNYNTLISGPGSRGLYRIMGNQNTANWITSSNFNDDGTFKNGAISSNTTALPMPATLLRFTSSAARTETRGILYNTQHTDRGWIGGVGEIIGFSAISSTSDRQKIEGYLAHKWGLADSLPSYHTHKTVSLAAHPISGQTYGTINVDALLAGSGGGAGSIAFGGTGGGAIKITAGGKLIIGKDIYANGGMGNSESTNDAAKSGAGGSGGAVYLKASDLVINSGVSIRADGGPGAPLATGGNTGATDGGGEGSAAGGGGRVYLEGTNSFVNHGSLNNDNLSANKGGNAVHSPFPAGISGLTVWLDAADSSTLFSEDNFSTSATTNVGGWQDKSGNGNHATQATPSKKPTYTISDALLKNKATISSSSATGQIGLALPSLTLQEIFIVAYYDDGTDSTFDGNAALLSGPGSIGEYRIMGSSSSANWLTTSNFNDAGSFKNGSGISSNSALPMPASLLRFTSSSPRSETRGILYCMDRDDRGWKGRRW
jgi:hypothetical protein